MLIKARLSGVEEVAKRFKQDKLFICQDRVMKFRDEIYQYIWDKKKGEPIKEYDDVLDSVRYAIYTMSFLRNQKLMSTKRLNVLSACFKECEK